MAPLPINKRSYRAFLSHAHVDKGFVDKLHVWLRDFAGVKVWYDSVEFPSGLVASELGRAIEDCQSAILVLTEDAIASGWVEEEWNICVAQQKSSQSAFKIVMLNLDGCVPPASLGARKWIDIADNDISAGVGCQIIEALHGHDTKPAGISRATFYLSRGTKSSEVASSEKWLSLCRSEGCRFVRDSPDQPAFVESRIKSLIASTSGVFAFVPNRGQGLPSKYVVDEIRFAKDLGVPALVMLEPGIARSEVEGVLPPDHVLVEGDTVDLDDVETRLREFVQHASPPRGGAHCFLGHIFAGEQRPLWQTVKRVVEVVSGLPCFTGDDLVGEGAQRQIVDKIARCAMSIFDISDDRLNSCIEAGIARGAGVRYELICRGPRQHPEPFMFRDKQIFFYDTPTELVGLIRKLVFDLRRVVN